MKKEYEVFGPEWVKEMNKLPKAVIIEMLAKKGNEMWELRERERFIKPTDQQLIEIAILFNDGKLEQEKLADMLAMGQFIAARLYENGTVMLPTEEELKLDIQ